MTATSTPKVPAPRAADPAPTTTPTIVEALAAVMGEVRALGKTDKNDQQGYNFRGIDAVVNAVGPVLRQHRVIVTPTVERLDRSVVHVGRNQTPMGHVGVVVAYTFHGPAGDTITCSAAGEAMDSGDKATPKAMSVAFRTALLQALCLPTHEPDPDAQTYERSQAPVVVRDERMEALRELRQATDAHGIETEAVRARWAADHGGEELASATDIDGINALRDIIQRGEFSA